jgi:uncharacterized protein YndB with AHSA1/START domain
MTTLTGSSTGEIDAPLAEVWKLVADVEAAPRWQGGLNDVETLEHDADGRAVLCEVESDGRVRAIRSTVRFAYEAPSALRWTQEHGELKSVDGSWELLDLGGGRTRATYSLEVELGRMLSLLIRGPLVGILREALVGARAGELKRAVEAA